MFQMLRGLAFSIIDASYLQLVQTPLVESLRQFALDVKVVNFISLLVFSNSSFINVHSKETKFLDLPGLHANT